MSTKGQFHLRRCRYRDDVTGSAYASSLREWEGSIREVIPPGVHVFFDVPVDALDRARAGLIGPSCREACARLCARPGAGSRLWITFVPDGPSPEDRSALVIEDDGARISDTTWREEWVPMLQAQSALLAPMGAHVSAGSGRSGTTYMLVLPRVDSKKPHPDRG